MLGRLFPARKSGFRQGELSTHVALTFQSPPAIYRRPIRRIYDNEGDRARLKKEGERKEKNGNGRSPAL